MKFNNRHNTPHTLPDGRVLWESRSVAVCGVVTNFHDNKLHILMSKRGPGCPDEVGKWCLPCGYLDYDESGIEAVTREIWEETGVDTTHEDVWSITPQPWYVNTDPAANRQNVTLYYALISRVNIDMSKVSKDHCEPSEVDDIKWMPVDEAMELPLAFNHNLMLARYKLLTPHKRAAMFL